MGTPDPSRYIYLYCGSAREKQRYAKMAEDAGVPLSKFVLSKMEEALEQKPPSRTSVRELEDMREKIAKLQSEATQKDAEVQRLRAALSQQQDMTWLDDDAEILQLNARLVEILKDRGPIHGASLLDALGIDPAHMAAMRSISYQLEMLEDHGFIRKGARGWKWIA